MPDRRTPGRAPPAWSSWSTARPTNLDGVPGVLDRAQAIDDDPGIDFLVFIDRSAEFSDEALLFGEDFTGARLFRVHVRSVERLDGGRFFPELVFPEFDGKDDVELDSADPATLRRFIAWGKAESGARARRS